jgi:hypothetical protein
MITHETTDEGCPIYREGSYWIEVGGKRNRGETHLYHKCPRGIDCDILLEDEVYNRQCYQCGELQEIPEELLAIYIMLDGRGVHNDGLELDEDDI